MPNTFEPGETMALSSMDPTTETRWIITYEINGHSYTTARFDTVDDVLYALKYNIDDHADNVQVAVTTITTSYRTVDAELFAKNKH